MIITAIQSIAGHAEMTAAQLADALAETILRPESFESFNTITIALDNNVMLVETMVAAMRSAGLHASADSLTTRGIDFGLPSVQSMIDFLSGTAPETFPTEIASTLKALGQQTRWASLGGIGAVPSEGDITDAIAADAASRRESIRIAALNDAVDAVRLNVDLSDEGLTLVFLQSAISDALAMEWQ